MCGVVWVAAVIWFWVGVCLGAASCVVFMLLDDFGGFG